MAIARLLANRRLPHEPAVMLARGREASKSEFRREAFKSEFRREASKSELRREAS